MNETDPEPHLTPQAERVLSLLDSGVQARPQLHASYQGEFGQSIRKETLLGALMELWQLRFVEARGPAGETETPWTITDEGATHKETDTPARRDDLEGRIEALERRVRALEAEL